MSDPVSNAEIEDVLSSIRRLVSEEASPLHRRKEIAEGAKERFVLTPALRVSEDENREATPETADAPQETGASDAAPQADEPDIEAASDEAEPELSHFDESRQTLEQRIAELEAALQQSPEEWEPDGSEVTGSAAPDMPSIADLPDPPEPESAPGESVTDPEDAPQDAAQEPDVALSLSEMDWSDAEDADVLEAAETEGSDEAAKADADMDVAVEEAEIVEPADDVSLAAIEEHLTPEPDGEPAPFLSKRAVEARQAPDDMPSDTAEADEDQPQNAQTEVLEPEAPHTPEASPETEPEPAEAEAVAQAEPDDGAEAGASQDEEPPFELFEDGSVIDEEALRDMVSTLVRDELQGVLGERITRNVRRLVRREIQRAIAMRELE